VSRPYTLTSWNQEPLGQSGIRPRQREINSPRSPRGAPLELHVLRSGMNEVSVRELRNQVSAALRRVEAGARVRVTVDRRPVAEIVPLLPPEAGWLMGGSR
jgi:hypothetical protein